MFLQVPVPDVTGVLPGIGIAFIVAIIVIVFASIISIWANRYRRAGPDEVLVISGRRGRDGTGVRIVRSGGAFVMPVLEQYQVMSLHEINTEVETRDAITKEGVPLTVIGTALFKIDSSDVGINNAAERYLGRPWQDMDRDVRAVLEGHLRGVCGTLTPEQIYQDRAAFQSKIAEQAQAELATMGFTLDTLTLRSITDEVGYLAALGGKVTAEVKRDARMGIAQADQQALMAEAAARQAAAVATANANAAIAEAEKERDVRMAQYQALTMAERQRAEQAGLQAGAEAAQAVAEANTHLAEIRAAQRRQELSAEVVAEAEATKQTTILVAEGERQSTILQAEASAQQQVLAANAAAEVRRVEAGAGADAVKMTADANAESIRLVAVAESNSVQIRGEAEGVSIRAKAVAEADGLNARAAALSAFTDEAMRVQNSTALIERLPDIVGKVSENIASVGSIRLLDFGGGGGDNAGGPIGRIFGMTPQAIMAANETLRNIGIDLPGLIRLIRTGEQTPPAPEE